MCLNLFSSMRQDCIVSFKIDRMQLLYATFRVTYVIARDRSDLKLTNLKEEGIGMQSSLIFV